MRRDAASCICAQARACPGSWLNTERLVRCSYKPSDIKWQASRLAPVPGLRAFLGGPRRRRRDTVEGLLLGENRPTVTLRIGPGPSIPIERAGVA
ncbi:hypothetical protein SKAU_G00304730 [Synaphobranchus kaupii]|uniref:Uncharacterized protein n=1 Tax=Synaphobranchus kaupii TaxID=118154 RepID=A0A9Q1EWE5_SYNKA|nr:hypothetical protein SKAU_G00304730 [Synaphobranchus kaupii]